MQAKYSSLIQDCYTCTGCIKIFLKVFCAMHIILQLIVSEMFYKYSYN